MILILHNKSFQGSTRFTKAVAKALQGLDGFTDWWHTTSVVSMEVAFDINNKELEVLKDNVQKQFREAMEHFD